MYASISLPLGERIMKSVADIFYQMEEEQDLFTLQLADGTYYWDIIRRDVYSSLNTSLNPLQKGLSAYSQPKNNRSVIETIIRDLVKTGINEISLRYLNSHKPNYIFTTFQRPVKGGRNVDYISDHLYDLVSEKSICIEHINQSSICYRDIFLGRKTRLPPVYIRVGNKDTEVADIDKVITNAASKYFDVSINIYDVIHNSIRVFKEKRNYYRRLFSKFLPKVIICDNDATYKGLYFAAREAQIPTIELQHGISPGSMMWTYSQKYRKPHPGIILPDVYLTLADCWNSDNEYPTTRTYSIGNDNLYQIPVAGENNILIISNLATHKELVAFAFELADLIKKKKIYYKIHPEQHDYKAEIVDVFSQYSNIEVISDEMNYAELFKNCNHVVGVRSTLIYIALQAGKNVYIYKRHNYNWDKNILKYVALFKDAMEFKKLIEDAACKVPNIPPVFFQKFDPKKFMQILNNTSSFK